MREVDAQKLKKKYSKGETFAIRINADLPALQPLWDTIFGDLLTESPYGVSWWETLPKVHRIVMGDYLLQCVESIGMNMVEARLHLMESMDQSDKASRFIAHSMDGHGQFRSPPRNRAADDLPTHTWRMHIAGVFRAINSSLDCLGATIVGALGLKTSLQRADLRTAREVLEKLSERSPGNSGEQKQIEFGLWLNAQVDSSGPAHWLDWSDGMRNNYVHRGRRLQVASVVPAGLVRPRYSQQARPVAKLVEHLPGDPRLSEVQAMRRMKTRYAVLQEGADETLSGVFASTVKLCDATLVKLLEIWETRKGTPDFIHQPIEQWRKSDMPAYFPGYKARGARVPVNEMYAEPRWLTRFRAAALDQPWDPF